MDNDCRFEIPDDEIIKSFQNLSSKHKYLTDFCRENSIPLWTGNLDKLSVSFSLIKFSKLQPIENPFKPIDVDESKDEWSLFANRLKHFKPDFVNIQAIKPSYDLLNTFGYYLFNDLLKLGEIDKRITFIKSTHERMQDKHVGIRILLFFSSSKICIEYELNTCIANLLTRYEKTEADLEREAEEIEKEYLQEEEAEDLEYQKEQEEKYIKIDLLARELCKERKLMIAKNADQRAIVARDFFGKRISGMDSWDIETLAKKAIDIFDFDELPSLVSTLKNQGKTPKQISDELGIGLAKIKRVFAIVPTESAPNANRDFLQSIIDGKDSGFSVTQFYSTLSMVRERAKVENDAEIIKLLDQVSKILVERSKAGIDQH